MSPIPIVFQHPDFFVIDKPAGIDVHSSNNQLGLIPLLKAQLKAPALWLVHRLDKSTSGLLIIATNKEAAAYFQRLFAHKNIDKCYLALSDKKPKKKMGMVIGDHVKARNSRWKLSNELTNPASTYFTTQGTGFGLRLFWVRPLTGKTHQIRVALKSLGSTILGDNLYGGTVSDRLYLHAYALNFEYHQKSINIVCPPTFGEHFEALSQNFSNAEELWEQVKLPARYQKAPGII